MKVTRDANILRNIEFSYDIENLYRSDFKVNYLRNEFGLRDRCARTEDIKVLTIGGSTTDQRYVPFQFTYQSILEQKLSIIDNDFGCVTNAGVDGHSTWGHLFAFKNWFPLIPKLQPKFILLYVGVNDADFRRPDSPNYGFDTKDNKSFKGFLKGFELVNAILPIYRYFRQFDQTSSLAYSGHAPRPYQESDYVIKNVNEATKRLSEYNKKAFQSRMKKILNYVKNLGAIPICITQPHRLVIEKNGEYYGIPNVLGEGFSGIDYDFSIKELNSVIKELCGEHTLDLHSHKFSNDHFYDGVHTTLSGSQEIGETIANSVISKFY